MPQCIEHFCTSALQCVASLGTSLQPTQPERAFLRSSRRCCQSPPAPFSRGMGCRSPSGAIAGFVPVALAKGRSTWLPERLTELHSVAESDAAGGIRPPSRDQVDDVRLPTRHRPRRARSIGFVVSLTPPQMLVAREGVRSGRVASGVCWSISWLCWPLRWRSVLTCAKDIPDSLLLFCLGQASPNAANYVFRVVMAFYRIGFEQQKPPSLDTLRILSHRKNRRRRKSQNLGSTRKRTLWRILSGGLHSSRRLR